LSPKDLESGIIGLNQKVKKPELKAMFKAAYDKSPFSKLFQELDKLEIVMKDNKKSTAIDKFQYLTDLCETAKKQSKHKKVKMMRKIVWYTNEDPKEAKIGSWDNPEKQKDLTKAQLDEVISTSGKEWYLVHPDSGYFSNNDPIPRYKKMSPNATVGDVLRGISDMTITKGPHEITDVVLFEGIVQVAPNVWYVLTAE
jgi:hypothetical protein